MPCNRNSFSISETTASPRASSNSASLSLYIVCGPLVSFSIRMLRFSNMKDCQSNTFAAYKRFCKTKLEHNYMVMSSLNARASAGNVLFVKFKPQPQSFSHNPSSFYRDSCDAGTAICLTSKSVGAEESNSPHSGHLPPYFLTISYGEIDSEPSMPS